MNHPRLSWLLTMFRESPELLAISRRWYKALLTRSEAELRNYLSEASELRFVGSADGEVWAGHAVRDAIGRHFQEVPSVLKKQDLLAEAFEAGDLGWFFFTNRFWFQNRSEPVDFRTTLVFTLENGSWKVVHRHASLPSSNEASIGHSHRAIQELLDAVSQEFCIEQTEGLASIMFTDIVNSSPIAEAIGDRAWSRIVAKHFDELKVIIEENDGIFVKSLGDGTMSRFSSARSAMIAAKVIQNRLSKQDREPKIGLRVGIHTGDVIRTNEDFFGSVVNKAARVTAVADRGEICVSDTTRAVIGSDHDFAFSAPETVSLRGLVGDHRICFLSWRTWRASSVAMIVLGSKRTFSAIQHRAIKRAAQFIRGAPPTTAGGALTTSKQSWRYLIIVSCLRLIFQQYREIRAPLLTRNRNS
ncbi:guanylate cyclase [Sulfitobacter sp. BDSS02]|uniref:adenylate/guanylate cyclase domain-containing protein n=1 Tax=Heliomarina sp. TaxID=2917556 RepID=UPI00405954EE|nr:guanylate cyclase [Sulfitobacter sp. BDSS02]MBR9852438.1 guanylate cyclase [Paracoccaceae bacterium]